MIKEIIVKLKFNEKIDKNEYIGLGGYEIVVDSKKYSFDLATFIGNINKDDEIILDCVLLDLDYLSDENGEDIESKIDLNKISSIDEFVVCVDEYSDLEVLEILELKILTEDNVEIIVSKDILENAIIRMVN